MINPIDESDACDDRFVVCDIENNPDGSVISIDTAWRNDDGEIAHLLHFTWRAWTEWLLPLARKDERYRKIYAHNGGGWDWLSLAHYLLTDGRRKGTVLYCNRCGSKAITLTIQHQTGEGKSGDIRNRFSVTLCDSLQLLRSSLDEISRKFLGEGKADTGGKLPHELPLAEMLAYQRKDTELLLRVLEKAIHLVRDNVAKIKSFSVTIGSTAMRIFRTIGVTTPIVTPHDEKLKAFLRRGYTGGRVEVFERGEHQGVNVYDINSLYPSAMLSADVPTSDRTIVASEFDPSGEGVYEIEFTQENRSIPACLTWGGKGIYSGSGVWYSPEIRLAIQHGVSIRVLNGYRFLDCGKLFDSYVNKLYTLRLQDKAGPLGLMCKFLLNSLYGKFAQKSEREMLCQFSDMRDIPGRYLPEDSEAPQIEVINREHGIYSIPVKTEASFEHVGIAGIITSESRRLLYDGLLAANSGSNRLLYCDTDSVHMVGRLPDEIVSPSHLGRFKHEFKGSGVYCGKKLYGLRDGNGGEKVRAKGVSVGGSNGCKLSYADLCSIAAGESVQREFKGGTTCLDVFKLQAPPCVIGLYENGVTKPNRKRTLRMT